MMTKKLGGQAMRLAGSGMPFCVWHVLTDHSLEDVLSAGYFDGYANIVEPFDRIEVTCEASSDSPKHLCLMVVAIVSTTTAGTVRKRLLDWQRDAAKARLPTAVQFHEVMVEPLRYETVEAPPAGARRKAA